MTSDLLAMSVELTRAHLTQNQMSHEDVPEFLKSIHATLRELSETGKAKGQETPLAAPEAAAAAAPAAPEAAPTGQTDETTSAASTTKDIEVDQPSHKVAPIRDEDISDPAYKGIDPWLAKRISPSFAKELNPKNKIHPTVFPDYLICLEDGKRVKLLRAYVRKNFDLEFHEYIDKWNLPTDYPTAPASYVEAKRKMAKATGLGVTTRANREKGAAAARTHAKTKVVKAKPGPKPGAKRTKKQQQADEASTEKATAARGKRRTLNLFPAETADA